MIKYAFVINLEKRRGSISVKTSRDLMNSNHLGGQFSTKGDWLTRNDYQFYPFGYDKLAKLTFPLWLVKYLLDERIIFHNEHSAAPRWAKHPEVSRAMSVLVLCL